MDKMFSSATAATDLHLSVASIAGVYSPLVLILITALVLL